MTKKNVEVVITGDEKPLDVQILQKHIVAISNMSKRMMGSGLKEETIVILLNDCTKVSRPNIRAILRALPELKEKYTDSK